MTERAENTTQPKPSGGRGQWFESTHSEEVADHAATLAATLVIIFDIGVLVGIALWIFWVMEHASHFRA